MVRKITGTLLLLAGVLMFVVSVSALRSEGPTWPVLLGTLAGIGLVAVGVMDTRAWYRQHPEEAPGAPRRHPARRE